MKAIGKISNISVDYSANKVSRENVQYTSERVTIFFEVGDDVHMVQVFNNIFEGNTSEEMLRRRNLFVGARGEMTIRYGFRDYNGKRYPDVSLIAWHCDNVADNILPTDQPKEEVKDEEIISKVFVQAEAQKSEAAEEVKESDLPF